MQDCKSLRAAVMIRDTLVNTQTQRERQRERDADRQLLTGYTISSASCAKTR